MTDRRYGATAEAAIATLRAALGPPWRVTVRDAPAGRASIEVAHPLTTPHGLDFDDDDRDHLRFIESFLGCREIRILAEAPEAVPHARLIRRLRDVAAANEWSTDMLAVLAVVLADQDVLTAEEGGWLGCI